MRRLYTFILVIILGIYLPLSMSEAGQDTHADTLRGASVQLSDIRLKGTLFTRNFEPIAVIEDVNSGCVAMYRVGDRLAGAVKIVKIARGEVVLDSPQGEYKLLFPVGGVAQPKVAFAEGTGGHGIRRDGNTISMDKSVVSEAIGNIGSIMKNVEVKPYFASGKRCGIKVTKLTPIGILKEAGVIEGDVIKSVNGLKVDTPHQIFSAYKRLKDSRELSVDIIRKDKPLLLTYKITG